MEQLRAELSHLLGEKLSRIECVSEKADTALWSLYDSQGNPMPLMARSFTTPGVAQQLAWKTTMLARSGTVRMPVVYGVMTHEEHPGAPITSCRQTISALTVLTASRSSGRIKRLLKAVKPLCVLIVSTLNEKFRVCWIIFFLSASLS